MTADDQTTGPVWRDRGTIIANQQARIAELEREVAIMREESRLRAAAIRENNLKCLEDEIAYWGSRAALAAEPTPAAEPHAEDGAKGRVMTMHTFFHDTHHDRPQVGCGECFPAPVADPDDTKDGQR